MDLSGIYFKILPITTVGDRRWAARWAWADIFAGGRQADHGRGGRL